MTLLRYLIDSSKNPQNDSVEEKNASSSSSKSKPKPVRSFCVKWLSGDFEWLRYDTNSDKAYCSNVQ